jgi:hypothetical protein
MVFGSLDEGDLKSIWDSHFVPAMDAGLWNVVSEEAFLNQRRPYQDIARQLRNIVGPATVLITLRDQKEILRSMYDMVGQMDQNRPDMPKEYGDWLSEAFSNKKSNFMQALFFKDVIETYVNNFGAENVIVVSMKRLFGSRDDRAPLADVLKLEADWLHERLSISARNTRDANKARRNMKALLRYPLLRHLPKPMRNIGRHLFTRVYKAPLIVNDPVVNGMIDRFYQGHSLADVAAIDLPHIYL